MSMKQVQRTLAIEDDFNESKPSRRWPATMRSTEGEVSVSRKLSEQPRSLGVKEVGRATKKSRCQGSWPSNQEVSAATNLAEQSRRLGERIWPSNHQVVLVSRKLAEQPRSFGVKEVGREKKESSDHEKSLRTMKRVFGP